MATFYFDGAVDNEWATLGNWRLDNYTSTRIPATSLPTSTDDAVVVDVKVSLGAGGAKSIRNITLSAPTQPGIVWLEFGTLTVTGVATFNDGTNLDGVDLVGDAIFNDTGVLTSGVTISGNVTFNDNSQFGSGAAASIPAGKQWVFNDDSLVFGNLTGSPTFNGTASNGGTITGNPVFNEFASNGYGIGGTVVGNATFNDAATSDGYVTGNATFNDISSNYGTVDGDATFDGVSANFYGTVTGNATFNDSSYNTGSVGGGATFNDSSHNESDGTIALYEIYTNRTPYPIPRGINGSALMFC